MNNPNKRRVEIDFLKLDQYKYNQSVWKLMETEYDGEKELKSDIIKFNFCFKKWKGDDGKVLKEQLFNEYHQLGVDIMNTDDEDRKTIYKLTRDRILDCSHKVGGEKFIEEIMSYKPVILNKDDLMMQYNKAHNDLLCEEFDKGDYTKTKQLFTFIKNTCLQFHRKEDHGDIDDTIDVDFIMKRIKNNAYSNSEYVTLFRYMFSLIRTIQSSSNDELLESFSASQEALKSVSIITLPTRNDHITIVHDGSQVGIGSVLYLKRGDSIKVGGYFSAKLSAKQHQCKTTSVQNNIKCAGTCPR